MPWTTLILLAMAVVSWRLAQKHADDVGRFLAIQSTLVCLLAALVKAPLVLQGVVLVGLLIYPTCSSKLGHLAQDNCPQLCLQRSRCQSFNRF